MAEARDFIDKLDTRTPEEIEQATEAVWALRNTLLDFRHQVEEEVLPQWQLTKRDDGVLVYAHRSAPNTKQRHVEIPPPPAPFTRRTIELAQTTRGLCELSTWYTGHLEKGLIVVKKATQKYKGFPSELGQTTQESKIFGKLIFRDPAGIRSAIDNITEDLVPPSGFSRGEILPAQHAPVRGLFRFLRRQ